MTWITESEKYANSPEALVEIVFDPSSEGDRRKYACEWVRPTDASPYKGNVLGLPRIYQSVGDIRRSFEMSRIEVVFSDTDREFRKLIDTQGIKNVDVLIRISFVNESLAAVGGSLVVFTGKLYDWEVLDGLRFKIICEQNLPNIDNFYPNKRVELDEGGIGGIYSDAHPTAVGWTIPIPYGEFTSVGIETGAYGHPSLGSAGVGTGLPLVDDASNSGVEKHLIGLQMAAITVTTVYMNGLDQAGQWIANSAHVDTDGKTHTRIEWNGAVHPTELDLISADISFLDPGTGNRWHPVDAIHDFLTNFVGWVSFDGAALGVAQALEATRGYKFDGVLWEAKKTLRTILDDWRSELELDIYANKAGDIVFKYLSAVFPAPNEYSDVLNILRPFASRAMVTELQNSLKYGYDFNYSQSYFRNITTRTDAASIAKYGGTYEGSFQGFRWIRDAAMAIDISKRKITRFKDPPVFVTLPFPLKSFTENLADIIGVSHFQGDSEDGYVKKRFQIRATDYDLDRYVNTMLLEDISAFIGKACLLGNEAALPALWPAAVGAERDYCYLCIQASGLFSDGEPGKRLYD